LVGGDLEVQVVVSAEVAHEGDLGQWVLVADKVQSFHRSRRAYPVHRLILTVGLKADNSISRRLLKPTGRVGNGW
jgi:hypothetical protein